MMCVPRISVTIRLALALIFVCGVIGTPLQSSEAVNPSRVYTFIKSLIFGSEAGAAAGKSAVELGHTLGPRAALEFEQLARQRPLLGQDFRNWSYEGTGFPRDLKAERLRMLVAPQPSALYLAEASRLAQMRRPMDIYYALPKTENEFGRVFPNEVATSPKLRALADSSEHIRPFSSGSNLSPIEYIRQSPSDVLVFMGHNSKGKLVLPNGNRVALGSLSSECSKLGKFCIFLSCGAERYMTQYGTTSALGTAEPLLTLERATQKALLIQRTVQQHYGSLTGETLLRRLGTRTLQNPFQSSTTSEAARGLDAGLLKLRDDIQVVLAIDGVSARVAKYAGGTMLIVTGAVCGDSRCLE